MGVVSEVGKAGNSHKTSRKDMLSDMGHVHTFWDGKWWKWGARQGG